MKSLLSRCWTATARSTANSASRQSATHTTASYSSLSLRSYRSRTSLSSSLSPSLVAPTILPGHSLPSRLAAPLPSISSLPLQCQSVRHATKKAGGSVKNSAGSAGKRLGLKASGGSLVQPGYILVRQRGLRTHPGRGVHRSRDETLVALRSGVVMFTYVLRPYRTANKWRQYVNVVDVAGGETRADVEAETRRLAEKYVEVLHMKRRGERVPTTRSVYLQRRAAEKRDAEQKEREQLIANVTAAQQADGGGTAQANEQRQ